MALRLRIRRTQTRKRRRRKRKVDKTTRRGRRTRRASDWRAGPPGGEGDMAEVDSSDHAQPSFRINGILTSDQRQ